MKKLILLLIIIPTVCSAQLQTLYLPLNLSDIGSGLRVDYNIGRLPLYSSATYGNLGLYKKYHIGPHIKITQGILVPLSPFRGWKYYPTAGISYNSMGSKDESKLLDLTPLDDRVFNPFSAEIGVTVKRRGFAFSLMTDVIRWEPILAIGYTIRGKARYSAADGRFDNYLMDRRPKPLRGRCAKNVCR